MPSAKTRQAARTAMLNRVARIEGQIKGVKNMIEKEDRCLDVLTQIMAVRSAVTSLGQELLKQDILCDRKRGGLSEEQVEKIFKTLY